MSSCSWIKPVWCGKIGATTLRLVLIVRFKTVLVSAAVGSDEDDDEDVEDGGCVCRALFFVLELAVFSSVEICCGSNGRLRGSGVEVDVTTPEIPGVVFDLISSLLMTWSVEPVIILKH